MRDGNPSLARSIRGPVTLITLGTLFALSNFTPYSFSQTWPVLLIVFGLLTLIGRGGAPDPRPPVYYPPPPQPPPPPRPPAAPAPGTYRQSPFPGEARPPDAGPVPKGGFGTSGAPRTPDLPGENV
jgi:hypothetical protein